MRAGLRLKVFVAIALSLAMADALGYAVARQTFESQEERETRAALQDFLGAVSTRLDERFDQWAGWIESEAEDFAADGDPVHLAQIVERGLGGAAHLAADGRVLHAKVLDESAYIPSGVEALATPAGPARTLHEGRILLKHALPDGSFFVAWVAPDFASDLFAGPWAVVLSSPDGARYGSPAALDGFAAIDDGTARPAFAESIALPNGWSLIGLADKAPSHARAQSAAMAFLAATTGAYFIAGAFILLVVGRTLQPLSTITEAARRLSAPGEPPIRLDVDTADEMQVLAETLVASSAALAEARAREHAHAERLRHAEVDQAKLAAAVLLAQREQDHRHVLEALAESVLVADRNGRVLLANPAAAAQGFAVGATLDAPLQPDAARALLASVKDASVAVSAPRRILTKIGRVLDAQARSITFENGDAVLVVATDVTERERLAAEADERRAALARSERLSSLGTLVAGVAHEINNPLTYINGNIELALLELESDPAKAEAVAQLRRALSGTERIAHITQSLRAVARHRPAGAKEQVDLVAVARNVEALLRVGLPPNVDLELDASREPVRVVGSSTELHQLLLNLVKNAIEAVAEKGGHVRIRCAPMDGEAQLAVEDDGTGLPPGAAERLFTPFYTTKPNGTGLGLSIAQGIARDHGGRIEVRSTPGKGATFRVLLPLAAAELPKRALVARSGP